MEDAGREHGAGAALLEDVGQVLQRTGAARGDDGDLHRGGDGPVQRDVVTRGGAVAIHAGQQDFAGAEVVDLPGPGDGVEAGRVAAAVREDFPASGRDLLRVDRDDDALAAELTGGLADEVGVLDRGSVEGDLVGAGVEHRPDVLDRAEPAADGEGHEDLVGGTFDHVDHRVPAVARGGDVQEDQLVGALFLVGGRDGDRVARIPQLLELHSLHDATAMDIEARDDADGEHG